jgi:hypothetical protein
VDGVRHRAVADEGPTRPPEGRVTHNLGGLFDLTRDDDDEEDAR